MMNPGHWDRAPLGYSTVETLLDDVSKQMSMSNLTRLARGSNGQRTSSTAGSMRVAKPNSTSNSPRGSIGLGRRRTVMADYPYRRRVTPMDQNVAASTSTGFVSNDGLQVPSTSNRPVSWHPSSYQTQQHYQPSYPTAFEYNNQAQFMNIPPTSAVYSAYTSPSSTFSPLSAPYTGYDQQQTQQQYNFQQTSVPSHSTSSYAFSQPDMMEQHMQNYSAVPAQDVDQTMYSHFDWSNFATNGFEGSTAPPTPDDLLPIQIAQPNFTAEESIPYQSLSDLEDTSDDLIGLGLYDTPEAAKSPPQDPQLDNYRTAMMSQLGSAYRRPESAGKGLKLEETWEPPSEDEKDEDDETDDEQDGEAEDDDEVKENNTVSYPIQGAQQFGHSGWL
ncbi:hypothetical protein LHYA1_G001846 [Lachnellula hyalina]|uniref:Uncharacterized protein n=1 Tax=Lachnellula hyalina TaxID=1316788 RepID=A0A8H8R6V9_9HELO|nr:uncharacterized protein LHYA1_G001846 [Lachnellula hyalina]TVY29454.1 hypothetical protein LHYA1_G001846 [Lachnellula hyalina]